MNHHEAPIGDELLSAWLDGELDLQQRERVATALEADPALAARLEALQLANELTLRHAAAIDALPLPARLDSLLQAASSPQPVAGAKVVPLSWSRRLQQGLQPLALAAGLLLAVGLSYSVLQRSEQAPAPAELALHAILLEQIASGEQVLLGDLSLSPRFSFRSSEGQWCRLYRVDAPTLSSDEVACRSDAGWELKAALPATAQDGDSYLAASSDEAALDAVLDQLMRGSPLPLANEAELIRQGWEPASQQ
jgi:hypothetical protein